MKTKDSEKPLVAIIIPVYNGKKLLENLLLSIQSQTYKNYEVIAVDNKSSDNSLNILNSFKEIIPMKIILNEKNEGYCGGCNKGIENAKGDLFLFLSQDRIISSNWLDKSVTKILTEQNVGCVFGKVISKGTSYDEYGAVYDIYGSPCMKGTTETTNLFYAGGAILVRSDIIEKIGAFDQKFFMYQEDIDLCWRIRLAGYRIEMVEDIECKNIGGGVSNTFYVDGKLFVNFDPELVQMPVYRFYHSIAKNRMRVLLKNYSLKNIIRRLPIVLGLIILRGTLMSIKTRNPLYFTSAFKGIFWNALYLRDTLNHRKKIQKYRKVNDHDIEKHMINRSIELESIGRLVNG